MHAGRTRGAALQRPGVRALLALAVVAVLCLVAVRMLLEPQRVGRFLLARAGASLGLDISASGGVEYALRGTPTLVLRGVVVREPGTQRDLLRADRILVSVPWSTIRARGASLDARRLELDAPVIELAALQHWLAGRPPSPARFPTLERGLRVRDGVLRGEGWAIDGIALDLPVLAPATPLHATLHGRYAAHSFAASADLAIAVERPGDLLRPAPTEVAVSGALDGRGDAGWHLPASIALSGPLLVRDGGLRVVPLHAGVAGSWDSNGARVPFSFGTHGALSLDSGTWLLADAGVVAQGRGDPATDPVPPLSAAGNLALGRRLVVRLHGTLSRWPASWPALPEPIDAPASPLQFDFDYTGAPGLDDIATLKASRDRAMLDARFRFADVQQWIAAGAAGSATPLPPLDARVQVPMLELDGARLEGIDATLDAPEVSDAGP